MFRGEFPDCFELAERLLWLLTNLCSHDEQKSIYFKPYGMYATAADVHIWFHSWQPRAGICGHPP